MKPQPTYMLLALRSGGICSYLFIPREHFLAFQRLAEYVGTFQTQRAFYKLFNNWRYVSINVHVLLLKSQIFFNKTPPTPTYMLLVLCSGGFSQSLRRLSVCIGGNL